MIAEGRYRPSAPFREVELDYDRLVWDRVANKSNYDKLSQEAMSAGDGRRWIVEYAAKPQLSQYGSSFSPVGRGRGPYGTGAYTPGLWNAYLGVCLYPNSGLSSSGGFGSSSSSSGGSSSSSGGSQNQTPCPDRRLGDAGVKDSGNQDQDSGKVDAGHVDAGDEDAGEVDAGDEDAGGFDDDAGPVADSGVDSGVKKDAGSSGSSGSSGGSSSSSSGSSGSSGSPQCDHLDDLEVALRGMSANDVWVTRLRAQLPVDALQAGDLELEAHPSQVAVSNEHQAFHYSDEAKPEDRDASCVSAPKRHEAFRTWALAALGALGLTAFVRRRRR